MTDSLKFGTSGLRGLAIELAGGATRRYTAAFVRHLRGTGGAGAEILVGQDLRASSPTIAHSVAEALGSLGVTMIDAGAVPTPALALGAITRGVPAIMVTGSHIPGDRNGLKFYTADGEIDKADEAGIVAALRADSSGVPRVVFDSEVLAAYRARYATMARLDGWRIGVWQHSTVARDLLVEVLEASGANVVPLGRSKDFVAVDTEAVSAETAAQIAAWVRDNRLDALVSADGDADRPLLADARGTVLRGDLLGLLTARALSANTVVTPVTSNSAIEMAGTAAVRRTKVGSPFVIAAIGEAMRNGSRLPIGFEANGGVLLGADTMMDGRTIAALPTRDALLPILVVLRAAWLQGGIAALVNAVPLRVARSDRLKDVPLERSAALLEQLEHDAATFFADVGTIDSLSDIDGLRFVLAGGDVVHYRPSGNAPELRCYTEAATEGRADGLLAWGLAAAKAVVR